jgi:hypothetical protein
MTTLLLAMDRASVRRRDANGFLHVEVSNISKANICPYYGQEIPHWEELGLLADQVYQLYRDPEELAKAAATFNNVPLLSEHMPVIPDQLPEELIIGSTGTDAAFDGVHLKNSLVVWRQREQNAIEANEQKELSCGYRYRADMTPGIAEGGLSYDGVMRDIMGNHVALVIQGRAGPDVVVGDDLMKLTSRTALMISGAMQAAIRPLLAADAKVDLSSALATVTGPSMAVDGAPKKLASKVAKLVKPSLAADKALDETALIATIASIIPLGLDEDKIEEAEDSDDEDDKPKGEDEDLDDDKGAEDEDKDDDDKPKGMDSATVAKMISDAEKRGRRAAAALDTARSKVKPLVGEVTGLDSAEAIYRFALKAKGYPKTALDAAPLATLEGMADVEIERAKSPAPRIAQDAKPTTSARDSYNELYKGSK